MTNVRKLKTTETTTRAATRGLSRNDSNGAASLLNELLDITQGGRNEIPTTERADHGSTRLAAAVWASATA